MFEVQRDKIDKLDQEILRLLGERFQVVREVGHIKSQNDITIVQSARVDDVLDKVAALAVKNDLSPDLIRHIYTLMIDYAHNIENEIKESYL